MPQDVQSLVIMLKRYDIQCRKTNFVFKTFLQWDYWMGRHDFTMTRCLVWMTHESTLLTLRQACKKAEKHLNVPLKLHGTYLKIYIIQCNDMLW